MSTQMQWSPGLAYVARNEAELIAARTTCASITAQQCPQHGWQAYTAEPIAMHNACWAVLKALLQMAYLQMAPSCSCCAVCAARPQQQQAVRPLHLPQPLQH